MSAALLAAALSSAAAQSLPGGAAAPPRLQMPQPSDIGPMFRVEVQAGPRLETVLDAVRRELAANPREHSDTLFPIAVPAVKVDVIPAIVGLARQIQRARRERSERRIHDEVSAELAEFCGANDCSATNEGLVLPDGN